MKQTITIARRFCGPPDSGNGGYVCGRLASFIPGPAVVRLRVPPPLDVEMQVKPTADGVEMVNGETLVATARRAEIALDVPSPPTYAEAELAGRAYVGLHAHLFPTCFVCGPQRSEGDGLRISPGKHAGSTLVASPWTPHASLAGPDGNVRPEFLWAALDCPGAFSFLSGDGSGALLGELAAALKGEVRAGERCVVLGWEVSRDGRKHFTGTALFSGSGLCIGVAKATWFEVPATR